MRLRAFRLSVALAFASAAVAAISGGAQAEEVAAPTVALAPAKLAIAHEIVTIAYPVETREAVFNGAMDAMLAQTRDSIFDSLKNDPGAEHIVVSKVDSFVAKGKSILKGHIPAMMDGLAMAYAREFSEAELKELRTFAQSPTGSHFLQRSSVVLSDPDFAAANQAYMRELQPAIEKMQKELVAELTAYFIEHPPKGSAES